MAKTSNSFATFSALQKQLSAGEYQPVYLIQGDEFFFIDEILNHFENKLLTEAEKQFNQTMFYGRDVKDTDVVAAAKRFPMMAERQVVILKEAQNIKKWDQMLEYLANPLKSTILVVAIKGGKLAGNTKIGKAFNKYTAFTATALKDYQIKPALEYVSKKVGYVLSPSSIPVLLDLFGADLNRIHSELQKLKASVKVGSELSSDVLLSHLSEHRQYNVFEYQKSFARGDLKKCLKITNYFADNRGSHPIVLFTGAMYQYFKRIMQARVNGSVNMQTALNASYHNRQGAEDLMAADRMLSGNKLEKAFQMLQELDLQSKGVNVGRIDDKELYKQFAVILLRN